MQRLIADANEYAATLGMASNLSINSFADIVQAIELVQEKQHIAGTTAKEAANTIQGSLGMAKSAWTNLVAGLANPEADINKLVRNFTDSAGIAMKNLLPTIKTGLQGVSAMVTEVLPEIFAMLPDLIDQAMPSFLETIDVTITKTFPALIKVISKNMPLLIKTIAKSGKTIVKSIFEAVDSELSGNKIYSSLKKGVSGLSKTFKKVGDSLWEDAGKIFASMSTLANKIDIDGIFAAFGHAAETLAPAVEKAGDGLVWLFDNAISPLIEWGANDFLPTAIDALSEAFRVLEEAGEFLQPVVEAVWEEFLKPIATWTADIGIETLKIISGLLKDVADYFEDVDWEGYWEDFDNFEENWKIGADDFGDTLIELDKKLEDFFEDGSFGEGWYETWKGAGETIFDIKEGVVDLFDYLEKNGEKSFDKIDEDLTNIEENWDLWQESFNEVIDNIVNGVEKVVGFFGYLEENGEAAFDAIDEDITNIKENWNMWKDSFYEVIDGAVQKWNDFRDKLSSGADTIKEKLSGVKDHFNEVKTFITDLAKDAYTWGSDLVNNFIDGVNSLGEDWNSFWEDFGGSIADYIGFSEPEKGELSHFHTFAPDMIDLFTKGITENADKPLRAIDSMLGDIRDSFTTPIASEVSGYTPMSTISNAVPQEEIQDTVTLQLVDGAYNIIARGVAKPLDIINGRNMVLATRGRQI